MRLSQFCFAIASFTAVVGMSLGIYMGISEDHSLAPVHVHLNLIGFVSMFLFGLYYHAHPRAEGRFAHIQVGVMTGGYIIMMAALAAFISFQTSGALFAAITGSVLVWLAMLAFSVIVWREAWTSGPARVRPTQSQTSNTGVTS